MRALLEPRCGGTEGTEYRHISFKSSAGYVLIVYAFMYALLNEYLLCSEVNVIIYARIGALGGGRTHTWRILSFFLISSRTLRRYRYDLLGYLAFDAGNSCFFRSRFRHF